MENEIFIMTLTEFVDEIMLQNKIGNEATIEHKEKFKWHKSKARNVKSGYHAPGIQENCEICTKIVNAHNRIMELETKAFGITGIPIDNMIAAIKITKGTMDMILNQGNKEYAEQIVNDEVNKDGK